MFNKQMILILTVALTAGTALQVIGFSAPGWRRVTFSEKYGLKSVYSYSRGTRNYIRCLNFNCTTKLFHDVTNTEEIHYVEVVSTLSITAAILSNVAALYCILKPQFYQTLAWLTILLTAVSASLIWTIIGQEVAYQGAYLRRFDFPYSLFLHALGSVVCLTVCTFHLKKVLILKQSESSRRIKLTAMKRMQLL